MVLQIIKWYFLKKWQTSDLMKKDTHPAVSFEIWKKFNILKLKRGFNNTSFR